MREINNFQLTQYVNLQQLECPCCHQVKISVKLVNILDKIRELIPVIVTSGYRCSNHNKEVGGAINSFHIQGLALDLHPIMITNSNATVINLFNFACGMPDLRGIGLYIHHVHIDLRQGKRAYWVKFQGENYRYFSNSDLVLKYFKSKISS